jgi:hypothetical protein
VDAQNDMSKLNPPEAVELTKACPPVKIVFESDGEDHEVHFTHKPVGLVFKASKINQRLPLVVEATNAGTRQLGVQPGWVLKSVNGWDTSGKTYEQVTEFMAPRVQKLPFHEKFQNGLRMVFESNGEQHEVCFTHKPLGLALSPELPWIVRSTSDAAQELGVQKGWVLKSVFEDIISESGLSYQALAKLIASYINCLPDAKTKDAVVAEALLGA